MSLLTSILLGADEDRLTINTNRPTVTSFVEVLDDMMILVVESWLAWWRWIASWLNFATWCCVLTDNAFIAFWVKPPPHMSWITSSVCVMGREYLGGRFQGIWSHPGNKPHNYVEGSCHYTGPTWTGWGEKKLLFHILLGLHFFYWHHYRQAITTLEKNSNFRSGYIWTMFTIEVVNRPL